MHPSFDPHNEERRLRDPSGLDTRVVSFYDGKRWSLSCEHVFMSVDSFVLGRKGFNVNPVR